MMAIRLVPMQVYWRGFVDAIVIVDNMQQAGNEHAVEILQIDPKFGGKAL